MKNKSENVLQFKLNGCAAHIKGHSFSITKWVLHLGNFELPTLDVVNVVTCNLSNHDWPSILDNDRLKTILKQGGTSDQ